MSDEEIDAALDPIIERMRVGWNDGEKMSVEIAIAVLSTLGKRVAAKRAERGLSYRDAAAIIGISGSTMYGIEAGKRDPGVVVVLRVLRWLTEDGETWEPTRKQTGRRSD